MVDSPSATCRLVVQFITFTLQDTFTYVYVRFLNLRRIVACNFLNLMASVQARLALSQFLACTCTCNKTFIKCDKNIKCMFNTQGVEASVPDLLKLIFTSADPLPYIRNQMLDHPRPVCSPFSHSAQLPPPISLTLFAALARTDGTHESSLVMSDGTPFAFA